MKKILKITREKRFKRNILEKNNENETRWLTKHGRVMVHKAKSNQNPIKYSF